MTIENEKVDENYVKLDTDDEANLDVDQVDPDPDEMEDVESIISTVENSTPTVLPPSLPHLDGKM